MKDEKHFGLRISSDLLRKFRYACEYDGRSANSQILFLIRQYVSDFEKEHGTMPKVLETKED